MDMRVRLPELLSSDTSPVRNAYELANEVARRSKVSRATAYRIVRNRGKMQFLDVRLLDVLCDIFNIEPNELLEREPVGRPRKRSA